MQKWEIEANKQDKQWKAEYLRKKKPKRKKVKKKSNKHTQKLANKYSNNLKDKLTPHELIVKEVLEEMNVKFEFQ